MEMHVLRIKTGFGLLKKSIQMAGLGIAGLRIASRANHFS
jgi:hypothetical protein